MRGFILLAVLAFGFLFAGCAQAPPPAQNESQTPTPLDECIGPVCGIDGVTYPTDCEAVLAGVEVDYPGSCMAQELCTDSDNGTDISVSGYCMKGEARTDDSCASETQIDECVCEANGISIVATTCPEGQGCSQGRCADIAPIEQPENETTEPPLAGCQGPAEADIYTASSAVMDGVENKDQCIDFTTVKDFFCKNGALDAINHQCPAGFGCSMGRCLVQPYICSETDSGFDLGVKGRTLVTKGMYTPFDKLDECIDIATLSESYCLPDGNAETEEVACDSGTKCVNGRCVRSKCSETDDGFDIDKRGTTTVGEEESTDECMNDYEIREYYCYGDEIKDSVVHCDEGYYCSSSNDRCIEGSID